jgi:hypothetical protein
MHTPARITVEEFVASPNATDAASIAVERPLGQVIVEKVAHAAEVLSKFGPAALSNAQVGHGLPQLALVAHHLCDCMPAAHTHAHESRRGEVQLKKCTRETETLNSWERLTCVHIVRTFDELGVFRSEAKLMQNGGRAVWLLGGKQPNLSSVCRFDSS